MPLGGCVWWKGGVERGGRGDGCGQRPPVGEWRVWRAAAVFGTPLSFSVSYSPAILRRPPPPSGCVGGSCVLSGDSADTRQAGGQREVTNPTAAHPSQTQPEHRSCHGAGRVGNVQVRGGGGLRARPPRAAVATAMAPPLRPRPRRSESPAGALVNSGNVKPSASPRRTRSAAARPRRLIDITPSSATVWPQLPASVRCLRTKRTLRCIHGALPPSSFLLPHPRGRFVPHQATLAPPSPGRLAMYDRTALKPRSTTFTANTRSGGGRKVKLAH